MAKIINHCNKSGCLILGANHLEGLLTNKENTTIIDKEKYHILSINLSELNVDETNDETMKSRLHFARNSKQVLQLIPDEKLHKSFDQNSSFKDVSIIVEKIKSAVDESDNIIDTTLIPQ